MDGSYLSLIFFIISTILYYVVLKPKLTLQYLPPNINPDNNKKLSIYLLIVLLTQFVANSLTILNKCGNNNIAQNIGVAGLMTFFPWLFMFGILIIVLMLYPGFKSAFSDVIGYFVVSSSANKLLTEMLIDTKIYDAIDEEQLNTEQKKEMKDSANLIIKMMGNMSILINKIVPSNFTEYWEILKPLMKEGVYDNIETKQKLLDIVSLRDNIGEATWFFYTAIFLSSVVQYNITTRGCVKNLQNMEEEYELYTDEENIKKNNKAKTQTTYIIDS
jgi:hypothetical protein